MLINAGGNIGRRRLSTAVLILLLPFATFAASLADYKHRVERAHVATNELFESRGQDDKDFERETLSLLEDLIPKTETVEWPGGSVETGNQWLHASLDEFADEPDETERAAILTRISERLAAISATIDELEQVSASERTKDQDKQKLAEILRREEYQKPLPPGESLFQKWLREFLEWLARTFPRAPSVPGGASGLGSLRFVLQILIYAIVIGLVGFLIYKFAPFLSRRFIGKGKRDKQDRLILGERIGADESASDLFSEAERLAREGDLRGAIRKGYIALLCDLSDRKILQLARHKTNRDYLRDVRKNEGLLESMTGVTRNYENNWYGLRVTEQVDWENFKVMYRKMVDPMKSRRAG